MKQKSFNYCYTLLLISFCTCVTTSLSAQSKKNQPTISYPYPLASDTPSTYLPGIISTAAKDFNAAFSHDGGSFYFSREVNKKSMLMVSSFINGHWTEAVALPFSTGQYADADPAFSPDGTFYFISTRPIAIDDTTHDYNIWFVNTIPGGGWTQPQPMTTVNSDADEYYVSFSANGNLYFSSSRAGGFGEEDIYMSKKQNGQYSTPVNLGPFVNTAKSEYDPFISRDEKLLIFASSGREGGFGGADLYAVKLPADPKSGAKNLGPVINTPGRDYCPYVSPDGNYFFYTSNGDLRWVRLPALMELIGK